MGGCSFAVVSGMSVRRLSIAAHGTLSPVAFTPLQHRQALNCVIRKLRSLLATTSNVAIVQ